LIKSGAKIKASPNSRQDGVRFAKKFNPVRTGSNFFTLCSLLLLPGFIQGRSPAFRGFYEQGIFAYYVLVLFLHLKKAYGKRKQGGRIFALSSFVLKKG